MTRLDGTKKQVRPDGSSLLFQLDGLIVETAADGEESFRGYIMYLDLMRVYNEEVAKFEGKE